jgi:hypothetical protein
LLIGSTSYDAGWTITQNIVGSITWPQDIVTPDIEQFKVRVINAGEGWAVQVAKGRVINRKAEPVITYVQSTLAPSCLHEFNLKGMAVYPTGSKTEAVTPLTDYMDDGAYFELDPIKEYALCIILNQFNEYSGTLSAGTPYAALMEVNGDAFTKTRPWGGEDYCDQQWFAQISRLSLLSIPSNSDPTDPELNTYFWVTHADTIDTETFTPMPFYLKNYNCQRLRIATITYSDVNNVWGIQQHLLGPITIPYNVVLGGIYEIKTPDADPDWLTTPLYDNKQTDWEGSYTDSEKWDGTGAAPTLSIDL